MDNSVNNFPFSLFPSVLANTITLASLFSLMFLMSATTEHEMITYTSVLLLHNTRAKQQDANETLNC